MKKSVSLLAILALAACGGDGSPSGNGNMRSNYHNRTQVEAFPNEAKESNDNITQVISRNNAQRADFVKYRLSINGYDNVTDETNFSSIGQLAYDIAGNASDAEINSLLALNNREPLRAALYVIAPELAVCAEQNTTAALRTCVNELRASANLGDKIDQVIRNTDTRLTVDKLEFTNTDGGDAKLTFAIDDSGKIIGITLDETTYTRDKNVFKNGDKTLTYVSGMDSLSPLMYSDFGKYTITDATAGTTTSQYFFGGYDVKRIDPTAIQLAGAETNMTFRGRAVGTVENATTSKDLNGNAELIFNKSDRSSQVKATFDDWYDVTVNTNNEISFDNFQGDAAYKFATSGDGAAHSGAKFDVNYYGHDDTHPTEAVGGAQYREGDINFNMAFGVKKQ